MKYQAVMHMHTQRRLFAKTLVWRIIATLTGAAIAAWLNPDKAAETAGMFIIIEFPLKMLFYYLHEIGWHNIEWGKEPIQLEDNQN